MTKIAVTGGSGKAGRAVVRDLLEHGHQVLNVDRVPSAESSSPDSPAPFLYADLTDYGETLEAISGAERLPGIEAVVHLAAIPSPVLATPDLTFRTNITSTHTVFSAAARLGLSASCGPRARRRSACRSTRRPTTRRSTRSTSCAPSPRTRCPRSSARRWRASSTAGRGIPIVGLRFSNVMERADYERFPGFWDDPQLRKWNLWGYVDESHVAQSVRPRAGGRRRRRRLVHHRRGATRS